MWDQLPPPGGPTVQTQLYVSVQGDDCIRRFDMDPQTGRLDSLDPVAVSGGPAPMVVDPQGRFLHVGRRGVCEVSSFRISPETGDLDFIAAAPLDAEPCYLAMDRQGRFLFSAYYAAGKAGVHAIDGENGSVAVPPVEWLDTATGAHALQTDPGNRFAFVPHIAGKGPNTIFQYRFDGQTGHLTPNTPARTSPSDPVGPRHFCFHPHKDVVYFSNEQGCSVTAYALDTTAGTVEAFQTVSTLPEGFHGDNTCAQIHMTPSGHMLFAPNRGHNSMACFAVDSGTGMLTPTSRIATEPVPRAFGIEPGGEFLFAAGLESGRLAAYRIDSENGTLRHLETCDVGSSPMWVTILSRP
jgi:6-phosphogluconolactonase